MIAAVFASLELVLGQPLVSPQAAPAEEHAATPHGPDGIDAVTLIQWSEACRLVTDHESEIWPGYQLAAIPALIARPNVAEVLIRHPMPPAGFERYVGESPLGTEPLFARHGRTTFSSGMDTSAKVGGVTTLVVTDRGARGDSDDAWNLAVMVHEGFHAWADSHLKSPWNGSELDLLEWPDLDPQVNAHLELEGRALAAALSAAADATDEVEEQALLVLAERDRRRARMPALAIAYEDHNESNEGLASYVEWRAYELWAATGVGDALHAALPTLQPAGFKGRADGMLNMLVHSSRGTLSINGSPYGPGAVRRRGYFFGAAIGRLLDRLAPAASAADSPTAVTAGSWKSEVAKGSTLTALVREALGNPSEAELSGRADVFEHDSKPDLATLVPAKELSAAAARREREQRIAAVLEGPGTLLVIELSALSPKGAFSPASWNPFGVLKVDDHRRLFAQSPTLVEFAPVRIESTSDVAVILDEEKREMLLRTPIAAEAVRAAFEAWNGRYADAAVTIEAPAVAVVSNGASDGASVRLAPRSSR